MKMRWAVFDQVSLTQMGEPTSWLGSFNGRFGEYRGMHVSPELRFKAILPPAEIYTFDQIADMMGRFRRSVLTCGASDDLR